MKTRYHRTMMYITTETADLLDKLVAARRDQSTEQQAARAAQAAADRATAKAAHRTDRQLYRGRGDAWLQEHPAGRAFHQAAEYTADAAENERMRAAAFAAWYAQPAPTAPVGAPGHLRRAVPDTYLLGEVVTDLLSKTRATVS